MLCLGTLFTEEKCIVTSLFLQGNEDLMIIHDELGYGHCRLSLAVSTVFSAHFDIIIIIKDLLCICLKLTVKNFVMDQIPRYGIFENINSLKELAQMPHWTDERPLRIVTGFTYVSLHHLFIIFLFLYFVGCSLVLMPSNIN